MRRYYVPLLISIIFSFFCTRTLPGQTISVVNELADQALRRAQLFGQLPLSSSFCIRPVHTKALGVSDAYEFLSEQDPLFSRDTSAIPPLAKTWWKERIALKALPIYSRLQYNDHHDYGWQDGPMIPNKGAQAYINGGVYAKLWIFEAQYAPEWVYAQNKPETWNPPVRVKQGDFPDRFGTEPYVRSYPGQTYVRAALGPAQVSIGTENVSWGPSQDVNLLMSNNAPGMPHVTMGTAKPIQTRFGSFEGQVLLGNLHYSGFRYAIGPNPDGAALPDVYRDSTRDDLKRVFSGLVAVYNPKWFPGLSVGAIRNIWQEKPLDSAFRTIQLIPALFRNPFGQGAYAFQTGPMDQIASVFFRYVMPESHVEIWGEFGRDDAAADVEDLLTSPTHSRGYQFGFRKLVPIQGQREYMDVRLHVVQCEAAKEVMIRRQFGWPVFYDSDYSNYGQNIGAGIGTGSNLFKASLDYIKERRSYGLHIDWVAHNNDLIYTGQTPWLTTWYGYDFTKKYIDWGLTGVYQEKQGNWIYQVKIMAMQTYNWNNWYHPTIGWDPNISTFRAIGNNHFSFNAFAQVIYLL